MYALIDERQKFVVVALGRVKDLGGKSFGFDSGIVIHGPEKAHLPTHPPPNSPPNLG